MLRKYVISILLSLSASVCLGQDMPMPDSAVFKALDGRLAEYFKAIEREPVDVQKAECDFLIESTSDSLIRDHVARTIYDHFMDSPVMGAEAVAIHVFDKWYQTGLVKMADDLELLGARIFAEFNRQSQIGCRAPELVMTSIDGGSVGLFTSDDGRKRFRVLYFYDTGCSKCRMQSVLLGNILATEDFPIDFHAIYVGDDRDSWEKYVTERFPSEPVSASVEHLWDPEMDSDFQRKYGVLQTPRLFLVAPDGTIIGRGLDAEALSGMLHGIFDEVSLDYGSKESAALFDTVFPDGDPSVEDVKTLADHIAETTLPKGDTVMFRQMAGDLLYYLATRSGEGMKEGAGYLIDEYILSDNRIWRSSDDSLKVVGFARIIDDLLSKSAVGSRIDGLKVPGLLLTSRGEKPFRGNLRRIGGDRNIVIFHTEGCNVCEARKKEAKEIFSQGDGKSARRIRVLLVNVDEIMAGNPSLASSLFDSFDLSSLPYIIETDRKGVIKRRYLSTLR